MNSRNACLVVLIGCGSFAAAQISFQNSSEVGAPSASVSGSASEYKLPPQRLEGLPLEVGDQREDTQAAESSSSLQAAESLAQFTPPTNLPASAAPLEQMIAMFQQERINSARDALRSPFGEQPNTEQPSSASRRAIYSTSKQG
jgi:hypothetical protein